MKFMSHHKHLAAFFMSFAVLAFVFLRLAVFKSRALLSETFDSGPSALSIIAALDAPFMLMFFCTPALIGGLGYWIFKDAALRVGYLSILCLLMAVICVAIGVMTEANDLATESGFGDGWVMYPPLSVEPPVKPLTDWVLTGFVLAGLSALLNVLAFLSPRIRVFLK